MTSAPRPLSAGLVNRTQPIERGSGTRTRDTAGATCLPNAFPGVDIRLQKHAAFLFVDFADIADFRHLPGVIDYVT
jgi:hypothetical protein